MPDRFWRKVRRDRVHRTYKDLFRENDFMTRGFISAILDEQEAKPDFRDGARVQRIIDAAITSHRQGRWVAVSDIRPSSGG